MTRRFWIALALSLPVVVLEMGGHLFNLHTLISQMTSNWVQFVLATPVVLWAGWPFFARGARSLVDTQSQHVHADRHGHRRRLGLQHRRDIGAGSFSASVPRARTARSRSISRPPPSSPFSCCSARCWNSGRANGPPTRSRRFSTSRQRPRGVFGAIAPTRKCRSMRSPLATACACGRAKKCRSMAKSRRPRDARRVDGHRRIHAG